MHAVYFSFFRSQGHIGSQMDQSQLVQNLDLISYWELRYNTGRATYAMTQPISQTHLITLDQVCTTIVY